VLFSTLNLHRLGAASCGRPGENTADWREASPLVDHRFALIAVMLIARLLCASR
jgi:hypothetical protein